LRQRLVARVLASAELDQQVAVQIDPFLGRRRLLQPLNQLEPNACLACTASAPRATAAEITGNQRD
jgi:hypothetical protein